MQIQETLYAKKQCKYEIFLRDSQNRLNNGFTLRVIELFVPWFIHGYNFD